MFKVITSGSLGDQSSNFKEYNKQIYITFDENSFKEGCENIFVQIEPNELISHGWLIENYKKYSHIYCWESDLLKLPNSKLFPFGTCWVNTKKEYNKEFGVSHLCSSKQFLSGHTLRHQVYNLVNALPYKHLNIRTPPRIPNKEILFDGYQYSIIIENIKKDNWFTEKLIDCLVTKTIPIYYGANNINKYFDDSYFLKFNNINELQSILNNLTNFSYNRVISQIEYNRVEALKYENIWTRLNKELDTLYDN